MLNIYIFRVSDLLIFRRQIIGNRPGGKLWNGNDIWVPKIHFYHQIILFCVPNVTNEFASLNILEVLGRIMMIA